jgi:hypothetical protein
MKIDRRLIVSECGATQYYFGFYLLSDLAQGPSITDTDGWNSN